MERESIGGSGENRCKHSRCGGVKGGTVLRPLSTLNHPKFMQRKLQHLDYKNVPRNRKPHIIF